MTLCDLVTSPTSSHLVFQRANETGGFLPPWEPGPTKTAHTMKCKEAEKGTKRKKERKPTLDILTIGQSDFEVQTWKKKKNFTHLHIDFLSVPLL